MSVELPKDAKGREIPLNVDALYSKDGIRMPVFGWKYIYPRSRKWMVQFLFDDSDCIYYPEDYYITPPDSWERLEEDLRRASERNAVTSYCRYFNTTNRCVNCSIHNNDGCCTHKDERAFGDILDRIRKLRGKDDA